VTDELFVIIRRLSSAIILGQRVVSATDYPFVLVMEEKRGCFERDEDFFRRKKEAYPIHGTKREGLSVGKLMLCPRINE
jgi:hypothetical protein